MSDYMLQKMTIFFIYFQKVLKVIILNNFFTKFAETYLKVIMTFYAANHKHLYLIKIYNILTKT